MNLCFTVFAALQKAGMYAETVLDWILPVFRGIAAGAGAPYSAGDW